MFFLRYYYHQWPSPLLLVSLCYSAYKTTLLITHTSGEDRSATTTFTKIETMYGLIHWYYLQNQIQHKNYSL